MRLSAEEIALIIGVSERHIRRIAAKEGWVYTEKKVRGGKKRFYDVFLIPNEEIKRKVFIAKGLPLFFSLFPVITEKEIDEIVKNTGAKIRKLREEKGLDVRQFACLLKTIAWEVILIEEGQISPTLGTLLKICRIFKVSLEELLCLNIPQGVR